MALAIIAEALARIEHKLDVIIRNVIPFASTAENSMSFFNICPLCQRVVEHQIDLQHNVVVRRCGCSSRMFPSVVPLTPSQQPQNGAADAGSRTAQAASISLDGD